MESVKEHEVPRFRPFSEEDMAACTRLAWEAWAIGPDETEEDVDPNVMEGYVRSFLARSNQNEVAYDSHGVIGLLFGRIGGSGGGSPRGELSMIPQFLFRRHGYPLSPLILVHFLMTEFKAFLNVPRSDAEVNLFIVDSKHRGRGVGTMLMDRFIERARTAGSKHVTLYTDDQLSNWKYYEKRGFKVVATFNDGLTSYFTERPAKGIVYALELR